MQYTFEELRKIVPHRQSPLPQSQASLLPENAGAVPIEICLAVSNRHLLKIGALHGERNNSGAKLVRDLIGVEAFLSQKSIHFEQDAWTLFEQFCKRCNPPLDSKEAAAIWKSAQKQNPNPCLSPEKLNACIQAWQRKQRVYQREGLVTQTQNLDVPTPDIRTTETQENLDTPETRLARYHRILEELIRIERIEDPGFQEYEKHQLAKREGINKKELQTIERYQKLNQELLSISVRELCAEADQDQDWLLENLLEQGVSLLLVSQSKTGKTPLVYDLAYSVATGNPWLGVFNVPQPGGVLIIQSDESVRASKRNFRKRGINKLDTVEFTQDFTMEDLPRLKKKIESLKTSVNLRLVVIDSLTTINRANVYSENDTEYARDLYELTMLAAAMGITIIITHHRNKGAMKSGLDIVSGSHQIPAAVDDIWVLHRLSEKEDPTKLKRVLERVAGHDGDLFQYVVQFDLDDRSWSLEHEYDSEGNEGDRFKEFKKQPEKVSTNIRFQVVELINQSAQFWSFQDVAEAMGISENTIRKALKELHVSGHIDRHKQEHNHRKRFVYCRLAAVPNQIKIAETNTVIDFEDLISKGMDQIPSQLNALESSDGSNWNLIHPCSSHDAKFDPNIQDQNLESQAEQSLEVNLIHASQIISDGFKDVTDQKLGWPAHVIRLLPSTQPRLDMPCENPHVDCD
jgi:predicted transcriptional regulator